MREITGYFDGNTVRLLEPAPKTKHKVIATFIDDENEVDELTIGRLSKYTVSSIRELEEGAIAKYQGIIQSTEQFNHGIRQSTDKMKASNQR